MLRANNFLLPPYTRTSITHARGLSLGFGASLVFGTLAGGMADMIGRKKICILFSLAYTGSCITKLWNNYHILMVGRKCSVEISLSNRESAREQWWGRSTPPLFFRVVSADTGLECVCVWGEGGEGALHCIALRRTILRLHLARHPPPRVTVLYVRHTNLHAGRHSCLTPHTACAHNIIIFRCRPPLRMTCLKGVLGGLSTSLIFTVFEAWM